MIFKNKKYLDKTQRNKKDDFDYETSGDISNTASANECTGLMYSPAQNEEELEAYQELVAMQIPRNVKED